MAINPILLFKTDVVSDRKGRQIRWNIYKFHPTEVWLIRKEELSESSGEYIWEDSYTTKKLALAAYPTAIETSSKPGK